MERILNIKGIELNLGEVNEKQNEMCDVIEEICMVDNRAARMIIFIINKLGKVMLDNSGMLNEFTKSHMPGKANYELLSKIIKDIHPDILDRYVDLSFDGIAKRAAENAKVYANIPNIIKKNDAQDEGMKLIAKDDIYNITSIARHICRHFKNIEDGNKLRSIKSIFGKIQLDINKIHDYYEIQISDDVKIMVCKDNLNIYIYNSRYSMGFDTFIKVLKRFNELLLNFLNYGNSTELKNKLGIATFTDFMNGLNYCSINNGYNYMNRPMGYNFNNNPTPYGANGYQFPNLNQYNNMYGGLDSLPPIPKEYFEDAKKMVEKENDIRNNQNNKPACDLGKGRYMMFTPLGNFTTHRKPSCVNCNISSICKNKDKN